MAWCPRCGRYWLLKTRRYVQRGIMGFGGQPSQPPDMPCPKCWISGDDDLYPTTENIYTNG